MFYKSTVSSDDYRKSVSYTRAKTKFGLVQLSFHALIMVALIVFGVFETVDTALFNALPNSPFVASVIFPFAIGAIFYILSLPFGYWRQFVLEESFGFNKANKRTFVIDQVKSTILILVLGIPLISALFWMVESLGSLWWIGGWILIMGTQLFIAAIAPTILFPLFNKFQPLEDGELKESVTALAQKVKFQMSGIFTMDGSKRSSHSNAFFAGLGKTRRIVLFDTLLPSLSNNQIIAVIAHEIGHYKKKHIQKNLALTSIVSLVGMFILALCLKWPLFFNAFGISAPSVHVGFVLFSVYFSVFSFPLNPLTKLMSRKFEYQADEYAVKLVKNKNHLVDALKNLSKENYANLTPHPWYSFFHYSHPTVLERASAIEKLW